MNRRRSNWVTVMLALGWCVAIPAATATQPAPQAAPPRDASSADTAKNGERWFYQRCSLCHMGRIVKDDTYQPMGPNLAGIFKNATPAREAQIREQIQRGSPRMPGFRYTFTPAELDEVVAYMKTL